MTKTQDIFKNAGAYLDMGGTIKTEEIKKAQAISEGIKHLQNFLNPFGITRLTRYEAALFSVANIEADLWDFEEQKTALRNLAIIKFSQDGKSREEVRDTIIGLSGGTKPKKKGNVLNFRPKNEGVAEDE